MKSKREIDRKAITRLEKSAARQVLKRARICLHVSHTSPIQEMITVFCKASYVRPHRQLGKEKSFHVLKGELLLIFFNRAGRVTSRVRLAAGKRMVYRFRAQAWHLVYPLTKFVALHEVIPGPFKRTEFAAWSPENGDKLGIQKFYKRIRVT